MISAAENIYNIMENVHLRLFLYQSSPLESKWSFEITLEDKIRFSKGALDFIHKTLYSIDYNTKSLDNLHMYLSFHIS